MMYNVMGWVLIRNNDVEQWFIMVNVSPLCQIDARSPGFQGINT